MQREPNYSEWLTRYLLGELPEHEQRQVEERYLGDAEFFAELLAVEAELIERYKRGALSAEQRERFENYFLRSAVRRDRLRGARQSWWRRWLARLGIGR